MVLDFFCAGVGLRRFHQELNWEDRMVRSQSRTRVAIRVLLLGASSIALGLLTRPACAQTGVATVTGTVTDSSKALVPAAEVTITNTQTGISRKTQSSDAGAYYFGALPIGPYKITVNKPGF